MELYILGYGQAFCMEYLITQQYTAHRSKSGCVFLHTDSEDVTSLIGDLKLLRNQIVVWAAGRLGLYQPPDYPGPNGKPVLMVDCHVCQNLSPWNFNNECVLGPHNNPGKIL